MLIDTKGQRVITLDTEFCIVGGGLSGMAAALSAARNGVKVVLVQDRPVLGGNCSSEVRMWVRGAKGLHNRETGILSELEEENIYRNPGLNYSLWDNVLYSKVMEEENIRLVMNCSVMDANAVDGRVQEVIGWQLTTYTFFRIRAKYFADCSGDSILAPLVGAPYRTGREAASEFDETIGGEEADEKSMGISCLMQARETDHRVPFIPPKWAYVYEKDEEFDFTARDGIKVAYGSDIEFKGKADIRPLTRDHTLATCGTNFWWIELGGEQNTLNDAEEIKEELFRIALGIWDHIKNRGDHGADNWELEWLGFLPGKRETRRYIGAHVLTQNDVESGGHFDDLVAYGGWPMDNHNPGGFKAKPDQHASMLYPAPSPYGIPYRVLYSPAFKNLFFAGRNISTTHAANSSTRVMGTCALLGEAMGNAAAICVREDLTPHEVYETRIELLRDRLRDAGCYLPYSVRKIPELTLRAKVNLSDADRALLFNGVERPDAEGTVNYVTLRKGSVLEFDFGAPTALSMLRIVFDLDFSRESVSVNRKMRVFAQKCNIGLDFRPMKVASTLVKGFTVYADGREIYKTDSYHNSLFRLPLDCTAEKLSIRFDETWGADEVHLFSCDVT